MLGQPQILELTGEQREVFENDQRFKVSDSTDSSETLAGGSTSASKTVAPIEGIFTEAEHVDESETVEDQDVTQEKTVENETEKLDSVGDLLKDNSRDDLDAIARLEGIQNPDELPNKLEVAKAIVDAQR